MNKEIHIDLTEVVGKALAKDFAKELRERGLSVTTARLADAARKVAELVETDGDTTAALQELVAAKREADVRR